MHNQNLGQLGEKLASEHLQKKGLQILQFNFKANYGEIDIIAKDKNTYVFVEVKTRIGDSFGEPLESVNPRKLNEVIKTAEFYLSRNNLDVDYRIDVVAISLKPDQTIEEIEWFENVSL